MIILIAGASHTGKTLLAQKLLEKYKIPYLSIDHLKMGLIRSGNTSLTPEDDLELVEYLWPIVREMIKTAIENGQDLIIEGGYIPFDWEKDFEDEYLKKIRYYCLIMSEAYINDHFEQIKEYANAVETRLDDSWCTKETVLEENIHNFEMCKKHDCNYILIDGSYRVDIELEAMEEMMWGKVIGAIVLGVVAIVCFIVSYFQFHEKGFLFNNAYIYASKQEKETMDKKPYYKQSGIIFAMIGSIFFINAVDMILKTGWLFYAVIAVAVIAIAYAIVSSIAIEKKKK